MTAHRAPRLVRFHGAAVVALALVLAGAGSGVVRAADPVVFGTPTTSSTWNVGLAFHQPITVAGSVLRAEILVTIPGAAGPVVSEVSPPVPGASSLSYLFDTSQGGLLPNTVLSARWRLESADGATWLGPSISVRYDDTRFAWQTLAGSIIRVHWAQGSTAFGQRALKIAESAISQGSALLGVTETEPIDFFIYPDQASFYDALGPATRENVGGQANPEIRTLFAQISATGIDDAWVGIVIPHELFHIVFDGATSNPYHAPPRWFNEGIAVYLSEGYGPSDRQSVQGAVSDGTLMPLSALTAQFPTTRDRFSLAYAESVAAIDYLVREHGRDTLVSLVKSYRQGLTDDEAFQAALGQTTDRFDAAWRASIGAATPTALGPQPAPTGPVPSDWVGSGAAPTGSPAATGTPGSSEGTAPSSDEEGGARGDSSAIIVVALLLLLGAALVVFRVTRARPGEPPGESGEPRGQLAEGDREADDATAPDPGAGEPAP